MLTNLILAVALQAGGPTLVNTGQAVDPTTFFWQRGSRTVYTSPLDSELVVYDSDRRSLFSSGSIVALGPYLFGELVLFLVDEAVLGQDLDQDGETDHLIYHVLDLETLAVTSLDLPGFDAPDYVFGSRTSSRFLGFLVQELDAGDLNGDGDAEDEVAHVYDAETREVRNLELATEQLPLVEGDQVFVYVDEIAQGGGDLNGDGVVGDGLFTGALFQHDYPANVTSSTGFAGRKGPPGLAILDEGQAGSDLNGDGVLSSGTRMFYVFDNETGAAQPLGLGGSPILTGSVPGFTALPVSELASQIDLNGDGDLLDGGTFGWSPRSGRVERLGLGGTAALSVQRQGNQVSMILRASEAFDQVDVTGDGDASDSFPVYWTSDGGAETLALPWTYADGRFEGALLAFHVFESDLGSDVNGDGQLTSLVQVVHDFSRDQTWAFPWATGLSWVTGGLFYVYRFEFFEGQDLNGDGSIDATVLFSLDPATGIETVYPASVEPELDAEVRLASNGYLAIRVQETVADLNGDGDTDDLVLHVAVP